MSGNHQGFSCFLSLTDQSDCCAATAGMPQGQTLWIGKYDTPALSPNTIGSSSLVVVPL